MGLNHLLDRYCCDSGPAAGHDDFGAVVVRAVAVILAAARSFPGQATVIQDGMLALCHVVDALERSGTDRLSTPFLGSVASLLLDGLTPGLDVLFAAARRYPELSHVQYGVFRVLRGLFAICGSSEEAWRSRVVPLLLGSDLPAAAAASVAALLRQCTRRCGADAGSRSGRQSGDVQDSMLAAPAPHCSLDSRWAKVRDALYQQLFFLAHDCLPEEFYFDDLLHPWDSVGGPLLSTDLVHDLRLEVDFWRRTTCAADPSAAGPSKSLLANSERLAGACNTLLYRLLSRRRQLDGEMMPEAAVAAPTFLEFNQSEGLQALIAELDALLEIRAPTQVQISALNTALLALICALDVTTFWEMFRRSDRIATAERAVPGDDAVTACLRSAVMSSRLVLVRFGSWSPDSSDVSFIRMRALGSIGIFFFNGASPSMQNEFARSEEGQATFQSVCNVLGDSSCLATRELAEQRGSLPETQNTHIARHCQRMAAGLITKSMCAAREGSTNDAQCIAVCRAQLALSSGVVRLAAEEVRLCSSLLPNSANYLSDEQHAA